MSIKPWQTLAVICAASAMLDAVYAAVQAFATMVRERQVEGLTDWIEELRHSEQREPRGFAAGLLEDYAAISRTRENLVVVHSGVYTNCRRSSDRRG